MLKADPEEGAIIVSFKPFRLAAWDCPLPAAPVTPERLSCTNHRIQLLPFAVNPILVVGVRHLEKPVAKEGANTVNRAANILTLSRYYQFKFRSIRVKLWIFAPSMNKWR